MIKFIGLLIVLGLAPLAHSAPVSEFRCLPLPGGGAVGYGKMALACAEKYSKEKAIVVIENWGPNVSMLTLGYYNLFCNVGVKKAYGAYAGLEVAPAAAIGMKVSALQKINSPLTSCNLGAIEVGFMIGLGGATKVEISPFTEPEGSYSRRQFDQIYNELQGPSIFEQLSSGFRTVWQKNFSQPRVHDGERSSGKDITHRQQSSQGASALQQ